MDRPSWDDYFFSIANVVSTRSDCARSKVGAVIVIDNRIISTGYNGAPRGKPGCVTCPRNGSDSPSYSSYHNCVAIHAEANALLYARCDLRGATLYTTKAPCIDCQKLIAGSGIVTVKTI